MYLQTGPPRVAPPTHHHYTQAQAQAQAQPGIDKGYFTVQRREYDRIDTYLNIIAYRDYRKSTFMYFLCMSLYTGEYARIEKYHYNYKITIVYNITITLETIERVHLCIF